MLCGYTMHGQTLPWLLLPPIHFFHVRETCLEQETAYSEWAENNWRVPACDSTQGREVQVIVMVVANQDAMNLWQIVETYSRVPVAARSDER